jgi:8-oxo-dGTP diphosphatase
VISLEPTSRQRLQIREVMCYLVRPGEVLLGRRMAGRAPGALSGYGGRLQSDETSRQAVVREVEEECGVRCLALNPLARLHIIGVDDDLTHKASYLAEVFWCSQFQGDPVASEEMSPIWCPIDRLPYKEMWDSDVRWLPMALRGFQCDVRIVRHFESDMTFSCYVRAGRSEAGVGRILHGRRPDAG